MDYGDDGSICTHGLPARVHEPGRGDVGGPAAGDRRAARLAHRRARARDAGAARGRRAAAGPLVRRRGDAEPLRLRRRQGLLRQSLPREPRLPGRQGGRVAPGRLRHRPVPLDLQARPADLLAGHHRQPEREPRAHRRALHRDDGDADAGGVRPGDARHDRPPRVRRQAEGARDDRAPAPRRRAQRARELHGPLLARERVRALRAARRQLHAARDRAHAGEGAGVHARVRDERALPDPGRVPAAREPAEARLLGQAVHRELQLAGGRAHALPGLRPRERRAARHLRHGRLLLPSTT